MMQADAKTTRLVLEKCRSLGFVLAGVAAPQPSRWADELRRWLAEGKHGEMTYLERHLEVRLDPGSILPGTRSILCVADRYHDGKREQFPPLGRGRIARYARGKDYHKVMKRRLHTLADALSAQWPEAAFRACVDTAPILEREIAMQAGLGAIGKHTLLIEPGVGSWMLLGELFTTLSLVPEQMQSRDVCGSCTRCIDACPTDAIQPYEVDATRCISYLTIEHRTEIDHNLHTAMGDWIFGCDICQDVCPHNQPTHRSKAAPLSEQYLCVRVSLDVLEVLGWSEEDRRTAFMGSAMKRARLDMMKRNALIAATNAAIQNKRSEIQHAIARVAKDEEEKPMVRRTAQQCLSRLHSDGS